MLQLKKTKNKHYTKNHIFERNVLRSKEILKYLLMLISK